MITGKTIEQLGLISPATNDLSIPVGLEGSTYRIQFQEITNKISAQGVDTIAAGAGSHAEGDTSISLGVASHAEGISTTSVGYGSHSEGASTSSVGDGSHAEGNATISVGNYSHTEGYSNSAGWRGYDVESVTYNVITINSPDEDLTPYFNSNSVVLDNNIYTYSSTLYSNPTFSITVDENLNNASVQSLTYSAIDKTGFDLIYSDGDDVVVEVPFPTGFTFNFLNNGYSSAFVSSNGYVTFGGGSSSCCFVEPTDIPTFIGYPGIFLSIEFTDGLLYDLYTGYIEDSTKFVIRFEGSYRIHQTVPANLIFNLVFDLLNPNVVDVVIESNPLTETNSGVSDAIKETYLATFSALTETSYRILTNSISYEYVNDLQNLSNIDVPNVVGNFTHAEGFNNLALSRGSHSEGTGNISVGEYSHSEGVVTTAAGYGSHSEGLGTIASGNYQTVMGKYNTKENMTSLVVIGNGTGDTSRSDIVLVNTDGVTINGNLTVTGTTNNIKKYVGVFTQQSTSDPVVTVLENSIGNIVWTRDSAGSYYGTLVGAFPANKTICFYTHDGNNGNTGFAGGARYDDDTVWVTFNDITSSFVDIGDNAIDSLQILVYP